MMEPDSRFVISDHVLGCDQWILFYWWNFYSGFGFLVFVYNFPLNGGHIHMIMSCFEQLPLLNNDFHGTFVRTLLPRSIIKYVRSSIGQWWKWWEWCVCCLAFCIGHSYCFNVIRKTAKKITYFVKLFSPLYCFLFLLTLRPIWPLSKEK